MIAIQFPVDPLQAARPSFDDDSPRRAVLGVLDSYHGTFDAPSEAIQNSVDAVEDARLLQLPGPFTIEVTVNLEDNWMSFLDTGVGMDSNQVARAFAPHVSFKHTSEARKRRTRKNSYRGFKGIGMTFLAYSTDDITIHSKRNGFLTRARMQYGHAWAVSDRKDPALLVEDTNASPLASRDRGTYLRIHFSLDTRPRDLRRLAAAFETWEAILRTKTAIGQVMLADDTPTASIDVQLSVVTGKTTNRRAISPVFLYPHDTPRQPPFRFLDLASYYAQYPEQSPPTEKRRQDGVHLQWDTARIVSELTADQRTEYAGHLRTHSPFAYAFVPYQASVWRDVNDIVTKPCHEKIFIPRTDARGKRAAPCRHL